jgi:hypothetical protein
VGPTGAPERRSRVWLAAAGVAALALVLAACSGASDDEGKCPNFQRGNQLWVCVYDVEFRDAVYYTQDKAFYVIRPKQEGNKIAVVDTQVGNDRANTVLMDVDENGYTLLDKDGKEYQSINPFKPESRELAPSLPRTEGPQELIWGKFEIKQGFGIRAKAIFEVPSAAKPSQLRWDTVDTVFVRFEKLKSIPLG